MLSLKLFLNTFELFTVSADQHNVESSLSKLKRECLSNTIRSSSDHCP